MLHDASIVTRPGRTFIRRLIDLLKSAYHRSSNCFLKLNVEARSDVLWWAYFIEHWNGLPMMRDSCHSSPDVVLTSDASGSWGFGAYSQVSWFQYPWPLIMKDHHITMKELLPIVIAAANWGPDWVGNAVLCQCDNKAVVYIINTGTSKDPSICHGATGTITFYCPLTFLQIVFH